MLRQKRRRVIRSGQHASSQTKTWRASLSATAWRRVAEISERWAAGGEKVVVLALGLSDSVPS